jgi:hypothetical protein
MGGHNQASMKLCTHQSGNLVALTDMDFLMQSALGGLLIQMMMSSHFEKALCIKSTPGGYEGVLILRECTTHGEVSWCTCRNTIITH